MAKEARARLKGPTAEELSRINALLRQVGGQNVSWGAKSVLDVLVAEHRLEAERLAARRILIATWVLAAATIALVGATVGLIVVTV